jgi:hypothetical protein
MTDKSVTGKAERLGFRLAKSLYSGYSIVDQNDVIVAPAEAWRTMTLAEADQWLNEYLLNGG